MSSSPHELTAGDLEDKVATLTLDGAEEADRWLRDNGRKSLFSCEAEVVY